MKIQFKADQTYQLRAIASVTELFAQLPKYERAFQLNEHEIVPNLPEEEELWETSLKDQLDSIQRQNGISQQHSLQTDEGKTLDGIEGLDSLEPVRYPSFDIEMETGTGKTYVYLRTIHELRKQYGWSKFLIVVPSVAIYQGVKKTFEITRQHFKSLYDNEVMHLVDYDGSNAAQVKKFATSTYCEILLITLDSFNKKSNNLYKPTDKLPGSPLLPYQYIQQTRPILILDEPQNMESPTAKEALRILKPLFALRYSATHKTTQNVVYRLTPVEAFREGLVKKIEVLGITDSQNYNENFISLLEVIPVTGSTPVAKVQTIVQKGTERTVQEVTLRKGNELHKITRIPEHEGLVVEDISAVAGEESLKFSNELIVRLHDTIGTVRNAVFRAQIRDTLTTHFRKQEELLAKGIKVLSLFFIDRVANYVDQENGIIRKLFDEEYNRLKDIYPHFKPYTAEQVRSAYFASRKPKKGETHGELIRDEEYDKNKDDVREAQKQQFELIMQKKEVLLTLPNHATDSGSQVAFIFAHSALKEGWDNPNVFQICTLNQTISERKKRQEVGRGLRLAVNQEGERVTDEGVNVLTVIANESYESYVRNLQNDYKETGKYSDAELSPKPSKANQAKLKRNDAVFNHPEFVKFWELLAKDVSYRIETDTERLKQECKAALRNTVFPLPTIIKKRGGFVQTQINIYLQDIASDKARLKIVLTDTNKREETHIADFGLYDVLGDKVFPQYLKDYKVNQIEPAGFNPFVEFRNGRRVSKHIPEKFMTEAKLAVAEKTTRDTSDHQYPVFNIIDRAAKATKLTRRTVQEIFAALEPVQQEGYLKNPEGFSELFIATINSVVASHIAENVVFQLNGEKPWSLDELFPPTDTKAQEKLLPAGKNSIYNQVQYDSNVEQNFINNRLKDREEVIFYFKFPRLYCVDFPNIVKDYNPDWGVFYYDVDRKVNLKLIRETKGTLKKEDLRFESEKRKLVCAEKYYKTLGMSYRHITDEIETWYLDESADKQSWL